MYQQHDIIIVPTPPLNLMYTEHVVAGNVFNITLTWSRPDPPNGIITQYNVSDITNSYILSLYCYRYFTVLKVFVLLLLY